MSEAAPYREFGPRAKLRDYVRRIWIYEADAPEGEAQRIAPDGCPEMIVHIGAPYAEISAAGALEQPPVLFAGQHTRPLTLLAGRRARVLGVRFEPDGAHGFLGRPMREATDRRIDLVALHGPRAAELLETARDAFSWDARILAAEDYVAESMASAAAPIDPLVREVVRRLERGESIGDMRSAASERQLQRRFHDCVGVAPRMLASIFRFRRVFDSIEQPERPGWIETALSAGYFDQPQMARDFRRFLGCTASEWARQKIGLAALLTRR